MENKNQKENPEGTTTVGDSRENFEENLKAVMQHIEAKAKEGSKFILVFAEMDEKEDGIEVSSSQIHHKVSPSAITNFFLDTMMKIEKAVAQKHEKTDQEQG